MSGRDIFGFDLETAAKVAKHQAYGGLEPWRCYQGQVHITSATLCRPDGSLWSAHRRTMGDAVFDIALDDMMLSVAGKVVYAHNAPFDVAWLIAARKRSRTDRIPEVIRRIKWHDSLLLTKWLVNGQAADEMRVSFSLLNLVTNFMKDDPLYEEFIRMKEEKVEPGMDPYWERRNQLDALMTQRMAVKFEGKLPELQRNGYSTEAKNIVPVANSWITGIRVDQEKLERVEFDYIKEQEAIVRDIGIAPSVMNSPQQLAKLMFDDFGLTPESYTPGGKPSAKADDVKLIGYKLVQSGNSDLGAKMVKILRYRELSTLRSKYVDGTKRALEHTGDGFMYGSPRIFGTYTGRFTYASKTLDTYQTGLALHQTPRKAKEIRSFLVPPEGMKAYEADASGQESRLMAIRSGDENMAMIFNNGFDFHCVTATYILGVDYHEFLALYKSGDKPATENRQFGKLTNLSGNYRIGANALSKKAFSEYDLILTPDRTWYFLDVFKKRYRGIPVYWDESIRLARQTGYAETFGGRRYKVTDWTSNKAWQSESTALMMPIQGSGASQKNIAIAEVHEKVPEADFCLDLHDATFYWVPEDTCQELKAAIDKTLDSIDYSKYWGFTPNVKLPFESMMGDSFADVK